MAGLEKDLVHYVKKIDFLKQHILALQQRIEKQGLEVLDIGCGTGNISLEAAKLGCRVTGVDVDKASVEYARKRVGKLACKLFVGNAQDLQLKERYDVIVASEVLEHLKQPEKMVAFISQHLQQEGFVFLSIPNGYGPSEISVTPRRLAGRFLKKIGLFDTARTIRHTIVRNSVQKARKSFGVDTLNNYGEGALHEHFFSLGTLRKLLGRHGLQIVEKQHSFILLGTFPFYYVICKSRILQRMDCKAADMMPAVVASGWAFIVIRAPSGSLMNPRRPSLNKA